MCIFQRNPDILLYCLPWAWPGWIGNGTRDPYTDIQTTSSYILKWILGAKKYHDLDIDYVGVIVLLFLYPTLVKHQSINQSINLKQSEDIEPSCRLSLYCKYCLQ
jgi:hypothetical protein